MGLHPNIYFSTVILIYLSTGCKGLDQQGVHAMRTPCFGIHYRVNEQGTRWSAYLRHAMPDPREHIGRNTFLKYHVVRSYIVFAPTSQWRRITLKIKQFSYPDPDLDIHQNRINSSLFITHQTCPLNFIRIHPQLFEISCTQTNR